MLIKMEDFIKKIKSEEKKYKKVIKWFSSLKKRIFSVKNLFFGKKHKHLLRNTIFFVLGLGILFLGLIIFWLASLKIPDFNSFNDRKIVNSTKIYDRTGEVLLYDIHQDIKKTDIAFSEMGENIKNATIAVEDSEFYNHGGIRLRSIIRATLANIFSGETQGGSTITQQLVKNTLLTKKKTLARKIKEWMLAVKIDNMIPKEKILEYYLNENPYGGTVYGIAEASKTYFGKKAIDLSLSEAAYLAAIPQSPTFLSPYGKNKDKLEARKNLVLQRMFDLKYISASEFENSKNEKVNFLPQETIGIKAPHFVFFIKDYLEQKYGSEMVEKGGLKVTTTLDYELQKKAEEIVKEEAEKNAKDWNGNNASLVAIDPKTGHILTMVGSRDYFDKEIDGKFNVATALRQPGSSFKPFIYAMAFNKGFTPETVLFDLPTEFQTTCDPYGKAMPGHSQDKCYMPSNYDGKFRGPISLRNALAQSINIPAVKLFYLAGLQDSLRLAESMGISSLSDVERYGLTLVIGGGEVSLLEITSAYGVFANSGIKNKYSGILKVEDKDGNILESYNSSSTQIIPKNTALTISDILSDNKARAPTFGLSSSLFIPEREVAAKTGTTNNNKDAWTVGYTPSVVVGVWAGNNDNKPMKKGGVAVAGPIWNKFMKEAIKIIPEEKFEKPETIDQKSLKPILRGYWQGNNNFYVDKISKKLAGPNTPEETKEEKIVTEVHSILYWINKEDIMGNPPENPEKDPQFNHWETPIQNWWLQNKNNFKIIKSDEKPTEIDDIHIEELRPAIDIMEPNKNVEYEINQKIPLKVYNASHFPLQKIDVFINNSFIETVKYPFNFYLIPKEIENIKEENELRIIAYDINYNSAEDFVIFRVKN